MKTTFRPSVDLISLVYHYRRILYAITRVELQKRHIGSAFGSIWLLLYPLLLLCIYLFVYAVVFKMSLPDYQGHDYAIFVFCGLIPFIGVSESLSTGCVCIKQNMHLVKNVMLPIEIVPIRSVFVSLATQFVGLGILLILITLSGHLSAKIILLPVVLFFQIIMLVGVVLILSSLAVALADVSYFVNLVVMLLVFVSPIGFTRSMVPAPFDFLINLNPLTYMIESFRWVLLSGYQTTISHLFGFVLLSIVIYSLGSLFFDRFKGVLVDYE